MSETATGTASKGASSKDSAIEKSKPKSSNDDTARRAFGEKLEEFKEALSVLYIVRNLSGRLKFAEKWPGAAEYIFGSDLIELDTRGPSSEEEFDLRAELENKAEERRIEIKGVLGDLKEKSVDSGVLKFEYVGKMIERFGGKIARLFYSDTVIERVSPGLLARLEEERKQEEAEKEAERQRIDDEIRARAQGLPPPDNRPRKPQAQAVSPASVEIPDDIKPIDTSAGSGHSDISSKPEGEEPPSVSIPEVPSAEVQADAFSDVQQPVPAQDPDQQSMATEVASSGPEALPSAQTTESSVPEVVPSQASGDMISQNLTVSGETPAQQGSLSSPSAGESVENSVVAAAAEPVSAPASSFPKPEKGACQSAFNRALAVSCDPSSYKVL
ncbi:MAG: hypothetical protein KDI90_02270 [Alphaproteobacteria bacterium]|nr:hypothetical protein [Alphaproteobacteria bacterium]MCB9975187.1 hypothetical protein [Rhodospirillales bacterium]